MPTDVYTRVLTHHYLIHVRAHALARTHTHTHTGSHSHAHTIVVGREAAAVACTPGVRTHLRIGVWSAITPEVPHTHTHTRACTRARARAHTHTLTQTRAFLVVVLFFSSRKPTRSWSHSHSVPWPFYSLLGWAATLGNMYNGKYYILGPEAIHTLCLGFPQPLGLGRYTRQHVQW